MRTHGLPHEVEYRRCLAVRRVLEGYSIDEVADFLEVHPRTVKRWMEVFRAAGWNGLASQSGAGRPCKLNALQEKIVLRWLRESPLEHGFATELWTASRLAQLIWEEWGIRFHRRYLPDWLRRRGLTPQKPQRVPRERDPEAIAAWLASDWPRIKKKRGVSVRASFCWTKAGF
jgi:transposase